MEDAHAAVLDLQWDPLTNSHQSAPKEDRLSFFGVYDGHGGDKVALYAGENLHKILAKQEAFRKGDFEQALKDGFLATDRAILNSGIPAKCIETVQELTVNEDPKYEEEVSGCTASVGLISKTKIYVVRQLVCDCSELKQVNSLQANAGDSRSVLGIKGRAKPLSFDHKPQNEGGQTFDRIWGCWRLTLSRRKGSYMCSGGFRGFWSGQRQSRPVACDWRFRI